MKEERELERQPLLVNSAQKDHVVLSVQQDRSTVGAVAAPPYRKTTYKFFSNFGWFDYVAIFVGLIAAVIQGFVPLAFYYFFGQLVDYADSPQLTSKLRETSLYFFAIAGIGGLCMLVQQNLLQNCGERVAARIRRELFRAITQQDITFFDKTKTGTLITRLSEDCATVRGLFSERLNQGASALFQFGGGLGFAFYNSWKMTLVMLSAAPLMGLAIGIQGRLTAYFTKKASEASSESVSVAEEVITNFRTVRAFSAEKKELLRFCKAVAGILTVANKKAFSQGASSGFTVFCIWAAAALAFFYGGILVEKDELTLGKLITIFGMMLFAVMGLSMALGILPDIFKTRASFALIQEIINTQPTIPYAGGKRLPGDTLEGHIEFEHVSFTYPTREVEVLSDLSFSIEPGQTVALVGESGSGKSTCIALLERFYDPSHGRLLIDGQDLRELDLQWYHDHVALVSQEPVLFSGTITENIRYGRDTATLEEVQEAARAANAHNFVKDLPDGYETLVGERGVALSGGQKQRVAIARAILKDPKILLLDEATSALDTESEHLVQEALDKLMVGRTSLIIAHRLSTVRTADVIFVLQNGRLVESGTHQLLLEQEDSVYSKLAMRQLTNSASSSNLSEAAGEEAKESSDKAKERADRQSSS
ncbi:Multidrug resistance protein 1 [Balamuthia mandrillaris]